LKDQRKEFQERERKAESKKNQFEKARQRERDEMHKRSVAKSMEIEQVIKQNLFQEEQRKEHIRGLQL